MNSKQNSLIRQIMTILNWKIKDIVRETGIKRQTFESYLNGLRGYKKKGKHIGKAVQNAFLKRTGIDLNQTIIKGHIIIVNPNKWPAYIIDQFKAAGAEILQKRKVRPSSSE
ncbi:hypothetical protein [Chitinophaga sp. GbtcB8]|uniref:hypothetical protein n=1 Tax=Chitinophaga sp. GbtcB8 TaxID=2824753 RepID=UPI001C301200|nr:hypothetical protein [Chitinophaga sp. GbtcB8]